MGEIIKTRCKNCGFSNTFSYGGNRNDYSRNCPVPAINTETLEFENVNYIDQKDNLKYLFYSDKFLKGDNLNDSTLRNFDLELNEMNNYCPKCKKYTFDFYIHFLTD